MERDLYSVVANQSHMLSKSELADIAKEALYNIYSELGEEKYLEICDRIIEEVGLEEEK